MRREVLHLDIVQMLKELMVRIRVNTDRLKLRLLDFNLHCRLGIYELFPLLSVRFKLD